MQKCFLIVEGDYCIADAVGTSATHCPGFEMLEFATVLFDRMQYCSDIRA